MVKSSTWLLLNRYPEEQAKHENYIAHITTEKIEFAREKLDQNDIDMLKMIRKNRICTSLQLAMVVFRDLAYPNRTANRRLKKLYELGCVDRFFPFVQEGSPLAHYVLGPVGAKILKITGFRKINHLNQNWKHTVAISEAYRLFVTNMDVRSWDNEHELKYDGEKIIRCDALVKYYNKEKKPEATFVEVDMNSENIDVLKKKVLNYNKFFSEAIFQGLKPSVTFVFNDKRRIYDLKKSIKDVGLLYHLRLTTFEHLENK